MWPETYEEVVMDQIDWTTFDFDRSSKATCKEMIGVSTSGKDSRAFSFELPLEAKSVVLNNSTETWFMTDFAGAADHAEFSPSRLADTPDEELLRSSTLKFAAPELPHPAGWCLEGITSWSSPNVSLPLPLPLSLTFPLTLTLTITITITLTLLTLTLTLTRCAAPAPAAAAAARPAASCPAVSVKDEL